MTQAYPLQWPAGWPRMSNFSRKRAKFGRKVERGNEFKWQAKESLTISGATDRIISELNSLGVRHGSWVISTDLKLRNDGLPRSDQREPEDPGVAVYWSKGDKKNVMAIDIYDRIADNLAAVAATLNALRSIDRHGGAQILERAFTGFTALAAPVPRSWREVLELGESADIHSAEARYKTLARQHHPDMGGDPNKFVEITNAIQQARKEAGQ